MAVTYNYAGSGHLLNQMEFAQQGDIYMPGVTYYFLIAQEKDNIIRTILIGTLVFSKNKEYARQFVDLITSDEVILKFKATSVHVIM